MVSPPKVTLCSSYALRLAACLALLVSASCSSVSGGAAGEAQCSPGEEMVTDSGMRYRDLECGSGEAAAGGDLLTVTYEATFADGPELDASQGFRFVLGSDQLIAGWSEGVTGMRPGDSRRIVIPFDLAFGEEGLEGLPSDADLIYEVRLLGLSPR
jgi:FKBP-type peptidyl-prolyl cis-trans isomerase FkpA